MKVYELIEKLQRCDPNAIVYDYENEEMMAVVEYSEFFMGDKIEESAIVVY